MITFRPFRGGFDTAINDSKNFCSLDCLYRFLLGDLRFYFARNPNKSLDEVFVLEPAHYDNRLCAFVSMVLLKNKDGSLTPFGYTW